ncbi:TrbC/VirB2 family protein [Wielerella bovis]|uniref:TrbC/VirB2 family protein n=1 Tax=Wielerella bovis TaxID=2917790 RepID=UPI00201860FD|nr:TrbC/VirB2 family protein [Wielerella bovis]ULJ69326.1 TrbC/VirB2 family protein [Wielerella bovis]
MNKFLNFINKKSAQYSPEIMEAEAKINELLAKPKMQVLVYSCAMFVAMTATPMASAAGFEAEGKSMADTVFKGIYAIVGVVALIVALWQAVEAWSGRKSWMDFFHTLIWIVVAAATPALVAWLWKKGQQMVFG